MDIEQRVTKTMIGRVADNPASTVNKAPARDTWVMSSDATIIKEEE